MCFICQNTSGSVAAHVLSVYQVGNWFGLEAFELQNLVQLDFARFLPIYHDESDIGHKSFEFTINKRGHVLVQSILFCGLQISSASLTMWFCDRRGSFVFAPT